MAKAQLAHVSEPRDVVYPESDGEPMADNTEQLELMVNLYENLDALLPDFVAANLLWYPVEGDPKTRQAPDVMVALGRPKGRRGSYLQWKEGGVAPHMVMEILSPGNTLPEMYRKLFFYERFGVSEYYVYDPVNRVLSAYLRRDGRLVEMEITGPITSPLLGIRFDVGEDLEVFGPDGMLFRRMREVRTELDAEKARAEAEKTRANAEKARAEAEKARAEAEKARADAEKARAEALEAKLRALGIDPDAP